MGDQSQAESIVEAVGGRVHFEPDGFVCVVSKPVDHDLEQAREIVDHMLERYAETGRKLRVLVDMRQLRSISRAARKHYQTEPFVAASVGTAMLVGSGLSRLLVNFIIGLNDSELPIRLFTDEQEARAWLRSLPER